MDKQRLSSLFTKYVNQQIRERESLELMTYIATCTDTTELAALMLAEWNKPGKQQVFDKEQSELILHSILKPEYNGGKN